VNPRLALVFAGQREHLVCHVQSIGLAGRPNSTCGEKHVDTCAGAQIKHHLAGLQLGERGGIAAS